MDRKTRIYMAANRFISDKTGNPHEITNTKELNYHQKKARRQHLRAASFDRQLQGRNPKTKHVYTFMPERFSRIVQAAMIQQGLIVTFTNRQPAPTNTRAERRKHLQGRIVTRGTTTERIQMLKPNYSNPAQDA